MRLIRFKQPWKKWQGGEIAGFPDAEAAIIVHAGVADYSAPTVHFDGNADYIERQQEPPADKQMRPKKRRKSRKMVTKGA